MPKVAVDRMTKSYWKDYYADVDESEYGDQLVSEVPRRIASKLSRDLERRGYRVLSAGIVPVTVSEDAAGRGELVGNFQALAVHRSGQPACVTRTFVATVRSQAEAESHLAAQRTALRAAKGEQRRRLAARAPSSVADCMLLNLALTSSATAAADRHARGGAR
jgi:hypothetical protein